MNTIRFLRFTVKHHRAAIIFAMNNFESPVYRRGLSKISICWEYITATLNRINPFSVYRSTEVERDKYLYQKFTVAGLHIYPFCFNRSRMWISIYKLSRPLKGDERSISRTAVSPVALRRDLSQVKRLHISVENLAAKTSPPSGWIESSNFADPLTNFAIEYPVGMRFPPVSRCKERFTRR